MTIRVALNHRTNYVYDRPTILHPHVVRLRPAPHCRTPILSYSLTVKPEEQFINWQQDPHGNFLARFVFPKPTKQFSVEVDLVADMTVINPFDFFIEDSVKEFPFAYDEALQRELRPFLEPCELGADFEAYAVDVAAKFRKRSEAIATVDALVAINQQLQNDISYTIRMEPGVQTPDETLQKRTGSCRDSSWLLVQLLRRMGMASRFVSGYLIQLAADQKPLDGPAGPTEDFTDLHAWTEVFLPGAGWVGMDPTSGLFSGEGHIPLAATPDPLSAAPITGSIDQVADAETDFSFDMSVQRIYEDPRTTKPYTESQWESIDQLGKHIDERLDACDARLTMGGEPTFVSMDDMEGAEWNTDAVGHAKRKLSEDLIKRLRQSFGKGGLLHYGQGKWYPGESLPRWCLACYWRKDGHPIWQDPSLIAETSVAGNKTKQDAKRFVYNLAKCLRVARRYIVPAFEDTAHFLLKEQSLPVNVDPLDSKLSDPEERARLAKVFGRGLSEPIGFVLPVRRQWWQTRPIWSSGPWPIRSEKLFLLPGDSPIGLRLPLDSLPYSSAGPAQPILDIDPFAPRSALPVFSEVTKEQQTIAHQQVQLAPKDFPEGDLDESAALLDSSFQVLNDDNLTEEEHDDESDVEFDSSEIVRTALCVEIRDGHLYVFMPPTDRVEDYLHLVAAIEITASRLQMAVVIEGYPPPHDHRIDVLKVTPDPGVIEVNTQPSESWNQLVQLTKQLYEDARQTRLGTEKFDLDGTHTGTGGGNHIVLGAATPSDSPFLRRPELLKSLLGYWINHPSLSYLFSSKFIGPTSQAPRVDEGRKDALYELELAFAQVPGVGEDCPPWLIDRIFRNLLIDLTGNTHRAEFCIDKLFSPDSSTGRLGLVELRGFEMPPHAEMSLAQQLLIRALVAAFCERPYEEPLIDWGTQLHDRFMLPYFVAQDFKYVIDDLQRRGFALDHEWFASHFEFRFPKIGEYSVDGVDIQLRTAIEPWYVLGEEPAGGGTVRFVDSSVERLEIKAQNLTSQHVLTCNGRRLPLKATGSAGEYVCGVRYRAWQPPTCLHPTIAVHTPLTIDVIDAWSKKSLGGCKYFPANPSGRNYETFPVNANEAEARRTARFFTIGHTPGELPIPPVESNPVMPLTLDLRRRTG